MGEPWGVQVLRGEGEALWEQITKNLAKNMKKKKSGKIETIFPDFLAYNGPFSVGKLTQTINVSS